MGNRLIVYSAEQIDRRRLELKVSLHPSIATMSTAACAAREGELGLWVLISSRDLCFPINYLSAVVLLWNQLKGIDDDGPGNLLNDARLLRFAIYYFLFLLIWYFLLIMSKAQNIQSKKLSIIRCNDFFFPRSCPHTLTRRGRRDVLILSRRLGPNAYDSHFHRNSFYSSEI